MRPAPVYCWWPPELVPITWGIVSHAGFVVDVWSHQHLTEWAMTELGVQTQGPSSSEFAMVRTGASEAFLELEKENPLFRNADGAGLLSITGSAAIVCLL